MASTESTAVNDLIELSKQRPVDTGAADELLFDERRRPAPMSPAMAQAQARAAEQLAAEAERAALHARQQAAQLAAQTIAPPPLPTGRRSQQMAVPPPIPTTRTTAGMPAFRPMPAGDTIEALPRHRAPSGTDHTHLPQDPPAVAPPQAADFAPAPTTMAPAMAPAMALAQAAAHAHVAPAAAAAFDLGSEEDGAMTERRPRLDAPALAALGDFHGGHGGPREMPTWVAQPEAPRPAPLPAPLGMPAPSPSHTLAGHGAAAPVVTPMSTTAVGHAAHGAPLSLQPGVTAPVHLVGGVDWFQQSMMMPRVDERELGSGPVVAPAPAPAVSQRELNTQEVKRGSSLAGILLAVAGVAIIGAFVGGYFYFDGAGTRRAPAAARATTPLATAEAPTPTPTPTPAPVATPAAIASAPIAAAPAVVATAQVDVTFTSTPSGAHVVLVDGGVPRPLGPTPITASIDRTKSYDVLFALDGQPTTMQRWTPGSPLQVAAVFGASALAAPPVVQPARTVTLQPEPSSSAASSSTTTSSSSSSSSSRASTSKPAARPTTTGAAKPTPAAKPVAAASTESATILISSKPVCSIVLDGKRTGLQTPARLSVAPGRHTVTLINKEHGFERTGTVTVSAGGTVKVVKDFSDLMKP